MDHKQEDKRKVHPWQKANLLSKLTFTYTISLFWRTYRTNKLEENNLYDVPTRFKSHLLGNELEKSLKHDLRIYKYSSIYRLLWSCYGREYLFIGLIQLIMRTIIVITIPMTLSKLVLYFQPYQMEITKNEAWFYAALLIGINMINIIYTHNYLLIVAGLGIKVKTAFCSLIYRKALKLAPASLSEITVGKIVTLMTKDVTAFEQIILYGNDIWIGFVQAGIVCYLIYRKMGIAAFVGVGFLLIIIPIQIYIGKKSTKFKLKTGAETDERLQLTRETLSAIKLIKMYTWENYFSRKILDTRRKEVKEIVKLFFTKIIILLIGSLTSKIAFFLLVMTYIWLGYAISAELVYFILTLFQRLRHALSVVIPVGIAEFAEFSAVVERIESVLNAEAMPSDVREMTEKIHTDIKRRDANVLTSETLPVIKNEPIAIVPEISLKEVTVENNIVTSATVNIGRGLTFLTGPLGCGKSVFLKTLMKDYKITEGSLRVNGRISYASQEPWIFPSTFKQNVIFGEKFDQHKYEKVLEVCALNFDLSCFEQGEDLIIGDKGINLSKGQKARINLARAVYKDCEIYLLDDCLNGLDAHVKNHVINNCIRGLLKDKLCILTTSSVEYLKNGDNVIMMEEGRIKSFRTVNDKDINEMVLSKPNNLENDKYEVKVNDESNNNNISSGDNEQTELLEKRIPEQRNIYYEQKKSGKVKADIYKRYVSYGGGYILLSFIMLFFILSEASKSYTEKLVSRWVDLEENLTYLQKNNLSSTAEYKKMVTDHSFVLILFSSLIGIITLLCIVKSFVFFNFTRRASNRLHKAMVENIMNAVMQFFETTRIGNILNRFSTDLAVIDDQFPFIVYDFFEILLALGGIIIILAIVNISFLLPAAVVLIVLFFIRKWYMPTGRNLYRLESATRSPIMGYLNATLEGLTTIRSFNAQHILTQEFDKHQDLYVSTCFLNKCCVRAFGLALDTSCTIFIGVIAGYFLTFQNEISVGNVGLAITQAFLLSGLIQYGIRKWAELENKMTSVERVLEYTAKKEEIKNKGLQPKNWPNEGKVIFENVSLLYSTSEDHTLRNISFTIEGKEKIGVVGRTGAGKTSIISTLFRLYDYEGKIIIDGQDISNIDLEFHRKNICIIPQDPTLFTGTVRSNIDPMGKYQDSDIWSVITRVRLNYVIPSLDMKIRDFGFNFSSGQRQLLCLARAVMTNNRIIVLDEATSNMDDVTDAAIHDVLDKNFASCTVITIAHKLQSVLKCDKVMVVEKGKILEYDNPNTLLKNMNGYFYKMAEKAGLSQRNYLSSVCHYLFEN